MRFTLKSKILFGILILLMVTVSFNLFYSYNLFVADKKAYIFESALKRAENLADQINLKFEEMRQSASLIQRLQNLSGPELVSMLGNNEELLFTFIVNDLPHEQEIIKRDFTGKGLAKPVFKDEQLLKMVKELSAPDRKLYMNHVEYILLENQPLYYVVNEGAKGTNSVLITFFSGSFILELLKSDQLFNNGLYRVEGNKVSYMAGPQFGLASVNELVSPGSVKGAKEIFFNNEKQLLAYVYYPTEKMLVLSSMPSAKAFDVTKNLILKTLFFAFALLGLAVVAGIFFSSSITRPILRLTEAAKAIAERKFETKTEIKTNDEFRTLSNSFDFMAQEISSLLIIKEKMIDELNEAKAKLEEYNRNLEYMVETRTLELKKAHDFMSAMVNSLDQGMVVFDSELSCKDVFTKASVRLFEKNPQGLSFPELLGLDNDTDKKLFFDWSKVTFAEMLPFESAVGLIPRERKWGKNYLDKDFKHVSLDYFPMRADDKLINVVAVATDRTKEIQSLEKFKEKEQYVSMILKIFTNKVQFAAFVDEVHSTIDQLRLVVQGTNNQTSNLKAIMIFFHTLNGGFGMFSIPQLQRLASAFETQINLMINGHESASAYANELHEMVETMDREFRLYLLELERSIGVSFSSDNKTIEIRRDRVLKVRALIDELNLPELRRAFYEEFVQEPVIDYFKVYNDLVLNIASRLEKKVRPLVFTNADVKVEAGVYADFFNSLVHLFRNCIDHGIESPAERELKGKDNFGSIAVSFEKDNQTFSVIVEDDGAGINPHVIRERLKDFSSEDFSLISDDAIIYKIFDPLFTTRDQVSSFSGRGVGMSAIKDAVDKMGGQVFIKSKVDVGSQFIFIFGVV